MRNGTKIALFSTLFVVFTAGVIGFAVWRVNKKPAKTVIAVQSTETPAAATLDGTKNSAGALGVSANTGLGGGTEGMALNGNQDTSQSSQTKSSSVPGPESFGQYEKYKNDKNALFSDLQVGDGAELTTGKKAAVIYKVWLTDGKLVDQSTTDKASGKLQALSFTMGDHTLIPGWEQAIYGMKVNGLRRMIIPSSVGYGPTGKDPVPPNAMLIIDVQLLQVQ